MHVGGRWTASCRHSLCRSRRGQEGTGKGTKPHVQEWVRVWTCCLHWALWGQWDPNLKARMHYVLGEISAKTHQTWGWNTATALSLVGCLLIGVIWGAQGDLGVREML